MKLLEDEGHFFWSHFSELRKVFVRSVLAFTLLFTFFWWFKNDLLNLYLNKASTLLNNSQMGQFMVLKLMDKFFIHLHTCGLFAFLGTIPFFFFYFWKFLAPALYEKERKIILVLIIVSTILFYGGVTLAFFVVVPQVTYFFIDYTRDTSSYLIPHLYKEQMALSIVDFISFSQTFMIIFGIIFELPLIILFLIKTKVVELSLLRKYRRHMIVLIFILAAIFTPPDPVSMLCMGIPMVILYEFGILLATLL